jgi:hypothetical protein
MPFTHVARVLLVMLFAVACAQKQAPAAAKKAPPNQSNVAATSATSEQDGATSEDDDVNGDVNGDEGQSDSSSDEDDDAAADDDDADDADDDGDDDVTEDESSGDLASLHVQVEVRRDGGTVLKVKGANDSWSSLTLPDDGDAGDVASVCVKGKTSKLEIAFVHPETGEVKVGSSHIVVTGSGSSSVKIAFDDVASGTPDDNVVTLTCDGGGAIEVN